MNEFYNLKRKDRGALVKEQLAEQQDIPTFYVNTGKRDRLCVSIRAHHVRRQLGTSCRRPFMAAASDCHYRHFTGLGDGVMGSRLLLGMHWPRDLVVATLISWLLVTLATGWLNDSAVR